MFVGCFCWWMVFDWPATARFLTEEDRLRLRRRLAADNQSSTAEEYDKRHVIAALKDWKCWGYAFIYMGNLCPLYAFSLFLPTILAGMGYKGTHAQLLSVPPYAVAATCTIAVGWIADRTRQRGLCNMVTATIAAVGFCMLLGTQNPKIQYAGTFLGAAGVSEPSMKDNSSIRIYSNRTSRFTPPFQTPFRGPATTLKAFTNEVSSLA